MSKMKFQENSQLRVTFSAAQWRYVVAPSASQGGGMVGNLKGYDTLDEAIAAFKIQYDVT